MHAYETAPSRRARDIPPISSSRYRDTGLYDYAQPARSSKHYKDPEPVAAPAHDRHRRKSVPVNAHEGRPSRRANVVASDDGRGSRDMYAPAYPERGSRHDAEAKTSDRNRQFREHRRGYETEEASNLRRAKSHSPRRAAREAADLPRKASPQAPLKATRADDKYAADPYRPSTKKERGQQYYGEDPFAGSRGSRDRGMAGKDYVYGSSPSAMPRPPAGDFAAYKTAPLSSAGDSDEKVHKHSRESRGREKLHHASAYPEYESHEPPRRARSTRVPEEKPKYDDYGYAAPPPRSKDRPLPSRDYDDPYDRAPRSRQRQSVPPPQARSRYPDMDDNYGAPPRRAASMNHGRHADYDTPDEKAYRDERRSPGARTNANTGATAAGGTSSANKSNKQKKWGKQAGKLFMTHAVPVIKQEAVPFLTKAAQAYMEQKKR